MKYAIKLGDSFYYDGTAPVSHFDHAGFVSKDTPERATAWADRSRPDDIVKHWWDNHENPKTLETWHCTIDSFSVGLHHRVVDEKSKKILFPLNDGPRPEVVEVADDFGREPWTGLG